MNLSTRDMARLGLLMLDKGTWNGKQIIPADWVRYMTSKTLVVLGASCTFWTFFLFAESWKLATDFTQHWSTLTAQITYLKNATGRK